ncbi:copper resistance CopC family protein [Leucobacter sp. M11]|uniref:copper resistance CopC family protein n=1 Tax=Leucobacter sp. M11 TaxID=2993565 RepID=UPI002D7E3E71|nr:copper resistance CopC family protein [Leucobacter sp. M11]MEB4615929.1 copper resistance protein CopC [Leucobacter sp. M11]
MPGTRPENQDRFTMRHSTTVSPARSARGAGKLAGLSCAVLAMAALLAFGPAPAALAHDQLVGTTPAAGSTVDEAPGEVMLEFSNSLIELGTEIKVTDASGEDVAQGEPQLNAREVTQALPSDLADGEYTVIWRVVSSDSHPISGKFSFVVGDGAPTEATPSESASSESASSESATATPGEDTEEPSGDAQDGGFDWGRVGLIALGGLVLGGVGYAIIAVRSRRK